MDFGSFCFLAFPFLSLPMNPGACQHSITSSSGVDPERNIFIDDTNNSAYFMILVLSLISIKVMMMRMKLMMVTLVRPISDCVVIWIFSIPTEAKLVKDSISVINGVISQPSCLLS